MSDPLIPQVNQTSNVQVDVARLAQQANNEANATVGPNQQVLDQSKAVRRADESGDPHTKSEIKDRQTLQKRTADVFLKFQVDENEDLTIFVLDKANKKIIRTIPASDISHMSAGELVELFV